MIHWGSKSDDDHENPRIAISFVCSDPEFEAPLLSKDLWSDDQLPAFEIRLLLICAQLIIYYQRFELKRDEINACYSYCKEHQDQLGTEYRKKVFVEFVKAMKETAEEQVDSPPGSDGKASSKSDGQDDEDDDYEEAVM